jgi:DNA-directed RNA polymerase subunit alpha
MDDSVDDAVIEIRATKAGPVTARMTRDHSSVAVVNLEHHILELQEDRDFRMELYVNKGRGFVLAEAHPIPRGLPADLVRVDAIYNPVRRANFVVEETRVGQRTDFDRLVLEVETDGSVEVRAAVQYAARLAIEHFSYLAGSRPQWTDDAVWGEGTPIGDSYPPFVGSSPVPTRIQDVLDRPIEDLAELSVRSRNSLQKENIQTVRDLVQRTEDQMLNIDNFGKKSLQEISEFLAEQGLRFGVRLEEGDNGTLWWSEGGSEEKDGRGLRSRPGRRVTGISGARDDAS